MENQYRYQPPTSPRLAKPDLETNAKGQKFFQRLPYGLAAGECLPIPVGVQVLAIFCHSVMVIVPNNAEHLKWTVKRMTEWFTAATYWEVQGTYTNATKGVEEETNFLVLSWTDADSLDQYWPALLEHALDLQQLLDQECIAVLRDGIPVLLRRQA